MTRRSLEELLAQHDATPQLDEALDLRDKAADVRPAAEDRPTPRPSGPPAVTTHARTAAITKKQFNVRVDQFRRLDDLVDTINAQRTDRTERISGSTLVRIAIDALTEHAAALHGLGRSGHHGDAARL